MNTAFLIKGKEKQPQNKHSYIFSGAVGKLTGKPEPGEVIAVRSHDGTFIGYGHYNPTSGIIVRLLEWDESRQIDRDWYKEKISSSLALRRSFIENENTDAYRLIFSEGDFLPGLIADRFSDTIVLQSHTSGMDRDKHVIVEVLCEQLPEINCIYEKSDGDGRKMEGLKISTGTISGDLPGKITVKENGLQYIVDVKSQKTGFYADQRENRLALRKYIKKGDSVLDLFSFSGGFALNAKAAGAEEITICDSSAEAVRNAKENFSLNGFEVPKAVEKDCFDYIRELYKNGDQFDIVIADPPKLMPKKKDMIRALRAYKDLNFNAMKLVRSGGIMLTFSCSGNFTMEMFKEMIAYSAKDSGRSVQILEQMHQASDHPLSVSVTETEYLKGLVLRII
jgi:23S rRNA (cytosine1962-C5)-methyltransferase